MVVINLVVGGWFGEEGKIVKASIAYGDFEYPTDYWLVEDLVSFHITEKETNTANLSNISPLTGSFYIIYCGKSTTKPVYHFE